MVRAHGAPPARTTVSVQADGDRRLLPRLTVEQVRRLAAAGQERGRESGSVIVPASGGEETP
ncbi:hypothetical protein ACL02O_21450 [Micromonospora sp. MS34]|uniref:hypothetical protein n=1 Tax=Micromonospora sp. MS34 TaxID=3385971 RepID=UPI00399F863D